MFNLENFQKIKEEVGLTKVVAVSKFASVNDILSAYYHGVKDFGESKVQHLLEKSKEIANLGKDDIDWHFLGRLQTNKIKQLFSIQRLRYIHSVDSLRLLKELYEKEDLLLNGRVQFFLQVNTSLEEEKGGLVDLDSLFEAVNFILGKKPGPLLFIGLMTMSRLRTDDFIRDANQCFLKLQHYKNELQKTFPIPDLKLSMGMSQDYQIALKYGADFVRIGSALFGD